MVAEQNNKDYLSLNCNTWRFKNQKWFKLLT